jgi:hypothetical protein
LIFKGGIINAWGKKTAVALQKRLFREVELTDRTVLMNLTSVKLAR